MTFEDGHGAESSEFNVWLAWANRYPRSSSFTAPCEPDEMKSAVLAWVDALGWRCGGPGLVFSPERILFPSLRIDASILEGEDETTAVFTALMPLARGRPAKYVGEGAPAGLEGFLEKVSAAFAAGVAAGVRASNGGAELAAPTPDLHRISRYERWRRHLFWPLMTAGPVLFLIVLALRGPDEYEAVVAGAVLWPAAVYMTYTYLRWWILGARYAWLLVVALLLWAGVFVAGGLAM